MPSVRASPPSVQVRHTPRVLLAVLPAGEMRVQTRALGSIAFGDGVLDLSCVEQLVDVSQTRALAEMVLTVGRQLSGTGVPLTQVFEYWR